MKPKALLFGVVWMLVVLLTGFNGRALAAHIKGQEIKQEITNFNSLQSEMEIVTTNTYRHQRPTRRTLSQRKGKKERGLAVDEVDYLGPRTHPPTKPPRK